MAADLDVVERVRRGDRAAVEQVVHAIASDVRAKREEWPHRRNVAVGTGALLVFIALVVATWSSQFGIGILVGLILGVFAGVAIGARYRHSSRNTP